MWSIIISMISSGRFLICATLQTVIPKRITTKIVACIIESEFHYGNIIHITRIDDALITYLPRLYFPSKIRQCWTHRQKVWQQQHKRSDRTCCSNWWISRRFWSKLNTVHKRYSGATCTKFRYWKLNCASLHLASFATRLLAAESLRNDIAEVAAGCTAYSRAWLLFLLQLSSSISRAIEIMYSVR